MPNCSAKKFKFIGCEIIYREACYLAATCPRQVDVEFLPKGLHDLETVEMLSKVQSAVDAADDEGGYEAILLGYARCNDGVVGLTARGTTLVVPRAHDCITFLFGSRAAYKKYFDDNPGTYFMSTGWSERNAFVEGESSGHQPAYGITGVMSKMGIADSFDQMVAKYGKENAEFIAQTLGDWRKNYNKCCYVEMGVCDEGPFIEQARREADEHRWDFELRKGEWTLLEKLFGGRWDEDFIIVPPGGKIVARNDEMILDVAT